MRAPVHLLLVSLLAAALPRLAWADGVRYNLPLSCADDASPGDDVSSLAVMAAQLLSKDPDAAHWRGVHAALGHGRFVGATDVERLAAELDELLARKPQAAEVWNALVGEARADSPRWRDICWAGVRGNLCPDLEDDLHAGVVSPQAKDYTYIVEDIDYVVDVGLLEFRRALDPSLSAHTGVCFYLTD